MKKMCTVFVVLMIVPPCLLLVVVVVLMLAIWVSQSVLLGPAGNKDFFILLSPIYE